MQNCGGPDNGWMNFGKERKVVLLLEKWVESICNRVMEEVGECIVYWLGRQWQRRKQLLYG